MPKEQKYAGLICIILSIVAGIGILAGIFFKWPLIITITAIPAIVYEIYRTEGFFTKIVSFLCLIIVLAVIFTTVTDSMLDLSKISDGISKSIPALHESMQAAILGPILLVILSIFLFKRTSGFYTKWLSIIILMSSLALFYTGNTKFFTGIFNSGNVQERVKKGIKSKLSE